jgi:ribosomal protein S18 acetylase RimI-like enzyme
MLIRPYEDADEPGVIALWRALWPDSAPHNDPATSIRKKRAVEHEMFHVAVANGVVVGTVMGGYDGHRGWVYAVGVAPPQRGQGLGAALVRRLEADLLERGCLKINLQVRATNASVISFYEKLGYRVEEIVSMGKRTYDESAQHGP